MWKLTSIGPPPPPSAPPSSADFLLLAERWLDAPDFLDLH